MKMKYSVRASNQFKKDVRKLLRSGADISKLQRVIESLENGDVLESRYRDHPLKGSLKGKRECHIGPDWLLLYEKVEGDLLLLLLRTGTHRDVLGVE